MEVPLTDRAPRGGLDLAMAGWTFADGRVRFIVFGKTEAGEIPVGEDRRQARIASPIAEPRKG
jgi:hypothetical protein